MSLNYLDFELPIAELESKIEELKNVGRGDELDLSLEEEVSRLEAKSMELTNKIFSNLGPWQVSQLARHPLRPYTKDYIEHIFTDLMNSLVTERLPMILLLWVVLPL